jgi:two-component system, chemotaxis family, CheB/CheR fusion protein
VTEEVEELAESLEAQRRAAKLKRVSHSKILAAMADAVVVVDGTGRVLLTNSAFDRLFGESAARSRWTDEHGASLPDENMPLRRAAQGGSFTMQFMLVDGDDSRTYFEANCVTITLDDHETAGVLAIRDITDRSLRRMQDQFLATASHELRTPLTVVHGYLGMMQRALDHEIAPRLRAYVELALSQTRRMEELIEDLLDAARLQRGTVELDFHPVDLVPVVARSVQLAQSLAPTQHFNFAPPEGRVVIDGDSGRIEQVLLNLMTNAVNFAPEAASVDIRLFRAGDMVCIEVQDYGPGISTENLRLLFAPFFQSDNNLHAVQNGLGLGLFVSKELVVAHGGTIGVISEVGSGTTFTVRLPAGNPLEDGNTTRPPIVTDQKSHDR